MHHTNLAAVTVSNASKIAERLRAHARLCRQIASVSWSEESAQKLAQLADECSRAAVEADLEGSPSASVTDKRLKTELELSANN
jgi:hypothetical protein